MSDKAIYTIQLNDKLSPGLKKAVVNSIGFDKQIQKGTKSAGGFAGKLGGLGGMLGKLAPQLALAGAAIKAFTFASDSVRVARGFESLENAINAASGSAKEGAFNMRFIREQAQTLGLPLRESAEGFKTMAGAFMGTSMEGQAARDLFKSVASASTVMGLSAEETKGTFLALGQMMSKGKVSAEELNGQLGERLPGALGIAARAMNTTKAELMKLMADGKLMSEDFLPAFSKELKKTFSKDLPKAVNSSQARLNRFNNRILELKLSLGRALLPTVNKVMGLFTRFVNFLTANKDMIVNNVINPIKNVFIELFTGLAEGFGFISQGFGEGATFGEMFRVVLTGLGLYLKNVLIPKIKVLSRVIGFTLGLAFELIKGAIEGLIITFQTLFASVKFVFTHIKEEAMGLKDILQGAFTLDSDMIAKGYGRMRGAGKAAASAFSETMSQDLSLGTLASKLFGTVGAKPGADTMAGGHFATAFEKYNFAKKPAAASGMAGSGTPTKKSTTSVDGIKSGRPTHINIDIGKLIENMNITATDVEDLTGKIKDQVAQALFSAVNNVNNIAGI